MTTKILIADDHPLFRDAIKSSLVGHISSEGDGETMLEAADFAQAIGVLEDDDEIDLLLLDLNMPGASGLSALVAIRAAHPTVPVVVVSATDDADTVRRSLELGASGFISKSSSTEKIRTAVAKVLSGEIHVPENVDLGSEQDPDIADLIARIKTLTPQQARVLGMLSQGLLNKQIAYELAVSEATIKAHVSAVLQKLRVDSRTQAVIRLSKIGADVLGAEQA
ncbi:MAG: response regulator transcription factor [Ahrensia sp.]|nr:response regulator transcription factor [Ahrensia sp.]